MFYKRAKDREYPDHYLKLLATDRDAYLPRKHRLTGLLDEFLELAELRCNFILLPVREMNCARYKSVINGEEVWLCDEVPATLSHIFDKDSLGRFFLGDDGEVDEEAVVSWVKREHLEMGFEDGCIARERVRPLIPGADPYEARWLTDEDEIYAALEYMIGFLAERQWVLSHGMTAEAV